MMMNMETTTDITNMVRDIIAQVYGADELGEWEAIANWYGEVSDDECDLSEHHSKAEVMEIIVTAMNKVYAQVEREIKEAEEQARWETRYWHERDYGGRL